MNVIELKEALWWRKTERGKILCTLCPRYCEIGIGQPGFATLDKTLMVNFIHWVMEDQQGLE